MPWIGKRAMPSWSRTNKRQYEHVKASELRRGRAVRTAKRIAAATVNKGRKRGR